MVENVLFGYRCKFRNFRMNLIPQMFDFQIICGFLNLQVSTCAVYKAYSIPLLARTLFLPGNGFTNISQNKVLANIAEFTVFPCVKIKLVC